MAHVSRRRFFRTVGLGAAAIGVASAMPATASGAERVHPPSAAELNGDPLVAYVRDVRAGKISVMVGEREVLITDKALARGLARAAG